MEQKHDLLGGNVEKGTFFFTTLVGMKQALKKALPQLPKDFPIIHNNDKKIFLRKRSDPSFPYAFASISNISLKEDAQNSKAVRRHGIAHAVNGTNSTVDKYYIFPIKFDIELHFVVDDFSKAAKFILDALVVLGAEVMSFKVSLSGGLPWIVRISSTTKEIAFPLADKDLESDPEGHDIVITFTVESYHGVVRETAKINNAGAIQIQISDMNINDDGSVTNVDYSDDN